MVQECALLATHAIFFAMGSKIVSLNLRAAGCLGALYVWSGPPQLTLPVDLETDFTEVFLQVAF